MRPEALLSYFPIMVKALNLALGLRLMRSRNLRRKTIALGQAQRHRRTAFTPPAEKAQGFYNSETQCGGISRREKTT